MINRSKIYSLIVTEQCNLNCKYCYGGKKFNIMMSEKIASNICDFIIKDIIQNDISDVQILFELGEPLLNFKIIKFVVNKLNKEVSILSNNKRRITFTIFSNLVLMKKSFLNFIKKNGIYISTSLDGPKEIHDFNRGNTFHKVTAMIENIKERKIPLQASAVITRFSIEKYKEIIDTYLSLGLQAVNFRVLDRIGFGLEKWRTLGYSASATIDFFKKSLLYVIEKNLDGEIFIHLNFLYLFNLMRKDVKFELFSLPCNTFYKRLVFDGKGNIFTCGEGKVHQNSIFFKIGDIYTGIDFSKVKNFWNVFEATKKYCQTANCKISNLCAPCLALNPTINKCNKNRCEELNAYFSLLSDLIKQPRIYNLFLKWDNFVRNKKYG